MWVSGNRDDIVQELRRLAVGWDHLGKPANAREAVLGALRIQSGRSSVRVGYTTYEVTEGTVEGSLTWIRPATGRASVKD